jgi:hypothetical protein
VGGRVTIDVVTTDAREQPAGGPYRERGEPAPESVDAFWRQNRRDRRVRRAIQVCVVLAALAPAAAIAISGATAGAESRAGEPIECYFGPSPAELKVAWGFEVAPNTVTDWSGPLPSSALPPSLAETPVAFDELRERFMARSEDIRACYTEALKQAPSFSGTIVVSLLIRRDGSVWPAAGAPTPTSVPGLRTCIERNLSFRDFPAPGANYGLIHVPLRFHPTSYPAGCVSAASRGR